MSFFSIKNSHSAGSPRGLVNFHQASEFNCPSLPICLLLSYPWYFNKICITDECNVKIIKTKRCVWSRVFVFCALFTCNQQQHSASRRPCLYLIYQSYLEDSTTLTNKERQKYRITFSSLRTVKKKYSSGNSLPTFIIDSLVISQECVRIARKFVLKLNNRFNLRIQVSII